MEKKMVTFITVSENIITGIFGGDIDTEIVDDRNYHKRIIIPNDAKVRRHDPIDFYDNCWNRKTDTQLITEGLLPVPEGYIKEADSLREMTLAERIIAGLDELPQGMKIENNCIVEMSLVERIIAGLDNIPIGYKIENDVLVEMTENEKLKAGIVSQAEIDARKTDENIAELNRRLAELQTPEMLAQAELDEEFALERKEKLKVILAVKQQPGWPIEVNW